MTADLSDIQQEVIAALATDQPMQFSTLQPDGVASNRFAYHLKQLKEQGLVEKQDDTYRLTSAGEQLVQRLDLESGERRSSPVLGVIAVVKQDDHILASIRKQEPYKGYAANPHAAIRRGEGIADAARRVLDERTGLTADTVQPEGMWIVDTYREDTLLDTHYHLIVSCTGISGDLQQETDQFTNQWVTRHTFHDMDRFKDSANVLDIADSDQFIIAEADRHQEDRTFTAVDILQEYRF